MVESTCILLKTLAQNGVAEGSDKCLFIEHLHVVTLASDFSYLGHSFFGKGGIGPLSRSNFESYFYSGRRPTPLQEAKRKQELLG